MKGMKQPTHVQTKNGQKQAGTLGRILRYVGKYPLSLAASLFFSVLTVAASLFVPVLFGDAIDCIMEHGVKWTELQTIFLYVLITIGVGGLS